MSSDTIKYRLEVINSSKKLGISKTAEIYKVDRSTVRRWIKRFETSGEKGLLNRSRKDIFQPKKQVPYNLVKKIIDLKSSEPKITIDEIKRRLNLSYSRSTIFKKLDEEGLVNIKNMNLSSNLEVEKDLPFTTFYLTTNKVAIEKDGQFYTYIYKLTEKYTKIEFLGFSDDFTEVSCLIFIDYFLYQLNKIGINTINVTIIFEGVSDKIVKRGLDSLRDRYKVRLSRRLGIPKKVATLSLKKEIIDELIRLNRSDRIIQSFAHLILSNTLLFNSFRSSLIKKIEKITDHKIIINRILYQIPPLDLDLHFDFNKVITNNYWKSNQYDQTISKANEQLKLIAASFQKKFKHQKAIEIYDIIISASSYTENIKLQIYSIMHKGIIFQKTGKLDQAFKLNQEGLILSKKNKMYLYQVKFLERLGIYYLLRSDFSNGSNYLEKALKMSKTYNFEGNITNALINLGALYFRMGDYNRAIRRNNKLLPILSDSNPKKVTLYANLGAIYEARKKYHKSIEYYQKGLKIGKKLNGYRQISQILGNMGNIYMKSYKDNESYNAFHQLLTLAQEQGNRSWTGLAYNNLGGYYQAIGDYKKGLIHYQKFSTISKELNDLTSYALSLLNIADLYVEVGGYKAAVGEIENSIQTFIDQNDRIYLPHAYLLKGKIMVINGKLLEAEKSFKLSLERFKGNNDKRNQEITLMMINLNKILRVSRGYSRYRESWDELTSTLITRFNQYLDNEIDLEEVGKNLKTIHYVADKIYSSKDDKMLMAPILKLRDMCKSRLTSLFNDLYKRSNRTKYLEEIKRFEYSN